MANAEKGEVDLAVGGKTYVLRLPTNSIVQIETIFGGRDLNSILAEWQATPSFSTLRALLWGALLDKTPDASLLDAGDIIDELGPDGLEALGATLGEVIRFRLSGPKPVKPAPKRRRR